MPRSKRLTKEIIGRALECPRLAYLETARRAPENAAGEPTSAARIQMHHGRIVGKLARGEFPGGRLVEAIRFDDAVGETAEAIRAGETILFEAAFRGDGIAVRTDILARNGSDGKWRLWEVKAGGEVKESYLIDLAVQVHALEAAGIRPEPGLILLDKETVRGDPSHFRRVSCAADVKRRLPRIRDAVAKLRDTLASPAPPEAPMERRCRDCAHRRSCWPALPDRSVFELYQGMGGWRAVESLLAAGLTDIRSIPADVRLTRIQKRQVRSVLSGAPVVGRGLGKALLAAAVYPIHFLDFEAVRPPIPRFEGQRPFDLVPFQWSCHVLREPDAPLEHYDYLRTDDGDPRRELTESLLDRVADEGSIIVYSLFEQEVLRSMAAVCPDLAAPLRGMEERLFDLLDVIRRHYYHPGFDGSFSIKNVLPVLAPGKGYETMAIRDGMDAVWSYYRLQSEGMSDGEREQLEKDLLEYCELDSLAMVDIYEALLRAREHDPAARGGRRGFREK
ncbi:MAG: DUF2779 domain-containing protein [Candidatus Eisenbacteria bacterium]|nr:DUF2779 domain-containing protein [Candidatus Eisenbacteria bacterium]